MAEVGQYVAVTNIPSTFHAADLRAHFSSFVENNSFICFHFRHRPEKSNEAIEEDRNLSDNSPNSNNEIETSFKSRSRSIESERQDQNLSMKISPKCCVSKVVKSVCDEFITKYNDQQWTDVDGQYLGTLCHLSVIKLRNERPGSSLRSAKSDHANEDVMEDQHSVNENDLLTMPELRPPDVMPRGNVGTPTLVFLDMVQKCLLPRNIINKLHLRFPSTQAKRLYSNVNFQYESSEYVLQLADTNDSSNFHDKKNVSSPCSNMPRSNSLSRNKKETLSSGVSHNPDLSKHKEFSDVLAKPGAESNAQEIIHSGKSESLSPISNMDSRFTSLTPSKSKETTENSTVEGFYCETFKIAESRDISSSKLVASSSAAPSLSLLSSKQHIVKSTDYSKCIFSTEKTLTNRERKQLEKLERRKTKALMDERIEERLIQIEKRYHNEDDAEEWDRHEAVEDDPSNQERNKERLYEEEIEQPWEKGGPGVVFYTDAIYWQAKDGDFDEQTADDLDVDFSPYEGDGPGDKDIQDFLKIRQEKRFRDGYDKTDRFSIGLSKKRSPGSEAFSSSFSAHGVERPSRLGRFECHTKGIGRKLLEKQGWKDGLGLGASGTGIREALRGDGQNPQSRKGLGFEESEPVKYGPSVLKKARLKKAPVRHLITTVMDDPQVTDPKEPLHQRKEPTQLKHRPAVIDKKS